MENSDPLEAVDLEQVVKDVVRDKERSKQPRARSSLSLMRYPSCCEMRSLT